MSTLRIETTFGSTSAEIDRDELLRMDVAMLRKVREHITAHPEQHDQSWWREVTPCGTTACVAGWAADFAGLLGRYGMPTEGWAQAGATALGMLDDIGEPSLAADVLFNSGNTHADVREMLSTLETAADRAQSEASA